MNVLVLTPDRVGSTLLQRLITIYMQFLQCDRPIINLHELTNGLELYWNSTLKQKVLGRAQDTGYFQTLPEIRKLLEQCSHYKTSRLARYHIRNRQDSIADQLDFYKYLNDNFYIISARRENLLEHALSWCIYVHSRRLNVYSHHEKFEVFGDLYKDKISVERLNLEKYLDEYVEYLDWCNRHFTIHSYFHYDQDRTRLEQYILGLDIFRQTNKITWDNQYDINFDDWNRCHYLCSDISGLSQGLQTQKLLSHQPGSNLSLQVPEKLSVRSVTESLNPTDQMFLKTHGTAYLRTSNQIKQLVAARILPTGIPIKLQTLIEKRLLIENWEDVVSWYNSWCSRTGHGIPYSPEDLAQQAINESCNYHAVDQQSCQKTDADQLESHYQANVPPQA